MKQQNKTPAINPSMKPQRIISANRPQQKKPINQKQKGLKMLKLFTGAKLLKFAGANRFKFAESKTQRIRPSKTPEYNNITI